MLRVLKNPLEVIPDWNTLQHNEIAYTNAQLTTANSEINRNGEYSSKLYFINVNNHIRNVIFTIYKDEIDLDGNIINGRVFFNNLEGIFIDGYIIEKGEFTKRYVLTKEIQKASFFPFFLLQDTSETSETYCWPTESNLPGFEMTFTTNNLTTTGPDESGGNETGHSDSYNWYYANGYGGMDYGTYINNATQGLPTGGGSSSLSTGQITSAAAAILMASPVDPDEEGKCPEGYKKNPTTGKCDPICIGGKVYDSTTKECNCPDGKVEDKNGNCVDKPCEGDLVQNPEIAPQTNSGIQGGIYGTCTRYGRNCPGNPNVRMHNGIDI